jgi:plasmid stability protein
MEPRDEESRDAIPTPQPRQEQGVQIKVWLPDGFYDVLKSRAARHRTSVAEEARRLMRWGLAGAEGVDGVNDQMARLDAYLRQHLEPLVWAAAMDSAWQAAYGRANLRANARDKAVADRVDQDLRQAARERVQRVLRLGHEEEAEHRGAQNEPTGGPDADA